MLCFMLGLRRLGNYFRRKAKNLINFSWSEIKIQSVKREMRSVTESPFDRNDIDIGEIMCVYETWIKLFVIQQHWVAILLFGFVLSPRECLRNSWEKRTFPKSEENYKTKSTINEKRQRWGRFYYCVMCGNYQKAVHYHQQWEIQQYTFHFLMFWLKILDQVQGSVKVSLLPKNFRNESA